VSENSCSRRTVTITSILFLVVLLPANSQSPTPSPTLLQRNPRPLNSYREPVSRGDAIASPTITPRPPRRDNRATFTPAPRPQRTDNNPYLITPTPPPPRRYNTVSPITPTAPPRRDSTENITTPTYPPRTDITPSLPIRVRPPIPDISPIIRFRPSIPDITANPTIRIRPPIPDITARPPIRVRSPIPDTTASATLPFRSPIPDITARPGYQPTLKVNPSPPLEVGKPVLFEVVLWQPPPPGWSLQYRFDFGDGTRTDWTSERQATHTYSSPGNGRYPVHVDIASTNRSQLMSTKVIDQNVDVISVSNPIPTATQPTPITPSPTPITPSPTASYTPFSPTAMAAPTATLFVNRSPSPSLPSSKMPWVYTVLGLFAVAALACLVYAKSKLKAPIAARPTFYAHSNWNTPQTPPRNLAVNYELRFNSNVSAGQGRVETHGASLIQQTKKQ
jgi:PKD domain